MQVESSWEAVLWNPVPLEVMKVVADSKTYSSVGYLDWSHDCGFPELPVVSGHVPQVAQ